MSNRAPANASLEKTPLHALHLALGAKMAPFAGYWMPINYGSGILAEHRHCRAAAALFDVSHMGQVRLYGLYVAMMLEALVPADINGLAPGRMRYALLTDETGGIIDDLIVTRCRDHLMLVVNAARKHHDIAYLEANLPRDIAVEPLPERALIALQGPAAARVLTRFAPAAAQLDFMAAAEMMLAGSRCLVSRSGYTGEDGFEISLPGPEALVVAELLLAEPEVEAAGLGARDTLRLEAGLCLYGQDIDQETTPVEAGLAWTIDKRRRDEGGFPGAETILRQLAEGAPRRRVGLRPDGGAIARAGAEISDIAGNVIGRVTSGGYSASVGGPVAMGYVARRAATPGSEVRLAVRGKLIGGKVAQLPFVPHRYHKS